MDLRLHPKQGEAFLTRATEALYGGAAGGGKSYLFRVAAISWCYDIPGLQVYLFRREYPDLYKNHMVGSGSFPVLLADWVNRGFCAINYSKNCIAFRNGSKIHLCHCKNENDVYGYQGAEIHVLMIDELTEWLRGMYAYLRGRVRLGGLRIPDKYRGLFPRILTGANPGGIGHNWVKAEFIDIAPPLALTQMPKEAGGMLRQYLPALLEDNPTLIENDPTYESRLEGLGSETLVRAMRRGDWDIAAGGMFDDVWDRSKLVLPRFEIPPSWRIERSFDWGSSKPFSVGWWARSDGTEARLPDGSKRSWPRGTYFRIGEWYGWNGKPNEGCRMVDTEIAKGIIEREAEWGLKGRVLMGPADSSIFDEINGDSPAKQQLKVGVKWYPADKRPGSRTRGWETLRRRMKEGLKDRPEEPALFVFDNCTQFIRTVPVLPRDPKKPDDVDTTAEDHIGDETRYMIMTPAREAAALPFSIR